MMKRTQVCNVEIRIEETWTLLKAKIVIKENVKTSKYQNIKVGNSGSNKWGRWTWVVTYWFKKFMEAQYRSVTGMPNDAMYLTFRTLFSISPAKL